MKRRITLLVGLGCLVIGMGLAQAQTHLILNSTYVPPRPDRGWVRVAPPGYKHSMDDAITNASLVKFQISAIPQGATIQSAKLGFYIQRSELSHTMHVYWTDDASWSYLNNTPGQLRTWQTDAEIAQYSTGQTGLKEIDVALWLQQEVNIGDPLFSVKFDHGGSLNEFERIASPDAWYSPHRPYLDVVYTGGPAANPDLTLSRHDIAFNTMWPVPGNPVTITATVHNLGGQTTPTGFYVRFRDNGVQLGQDVWVNPIPGGGGIGTAQVSWNPTEGVHPIEVIADATGLITEINEYNNSNTGASNDGEAYTYEVRPQYKFYTESFETEYPSGQWGRYKEDADEAWNGGMGHQDWDVLGTWGPGQAYDGNWYLAMTMVGPYDDGTVWVERYVPIQASSNVTFVEHTFFAHDGSGDFGHYRAFGYVGTWDADLEGDFQTSGMVSPPTWRRYRSYSFLVPPQKPECWVGAGFTVESTVDSARDFFDFCTVRVNPPRSTEANATATAYNNGAKLVWDGLSFQHLIYVSGDSIFYSKSEDPAGNTWSNPEFVGLPLGQHPTIALDIDGYPRAVWRSGRDIYYSKRSVSGWSAPYRLYRHTNGHTVETPSLAIDGTYHGHVTWEHYNAGTGLSEILYGYFDATLTNPLLTTTTVQASASGIRCQNPAIALDGNNPQVVYSRPPSSGQPTDIFQAKKQGSSWPKFNVSSSPSAGSDHPHMAIQNGDVQVVWSEGGGSEIYHRAYVAFFGVWGTITNVSNTSGGSDYPRIVMPGYHVTWMDHSEGWSENLYPKPPVSKNPWQIYYTSPGAVPGTWNPATNLVPTYENSNYPQATRWQDLVGNSYLTAVHTEGDVSLYTLEATVKSLSAPPPGGSGGEMLLAVNADEPAPGGSRALWKSVPFDVPRDLEISFAISGAADNQDEMKLVLDDHDFGWDTPEAWNGQELRGLRKVVRFSESLKAGKHTLELHTSGQPVFKGLRVWHGDVGGGPQSSGLVTDVPTSTFLAQSFPNPTFGKATISYGLTKEGPVKLSIYNALGQVVRELVSENQRPGFHRVEWDGKSQAGKQVTSGIYFYRLNAVGFSKTNKLVVVR